MTLTLTEMIDTFERDHPDKEWLLRNDKLKDDKQSDGKWYFCNILYDLPNDGGRVRYPTFARTKEDAFASAVERLEIGEQPGIILRYKAHSKLELVQ